MELVSSRTALCLTRGGWACGQPGQAAGLSLCSFASSNTPRNRFALVDNAVLSPFFQTRCALRLLRSGRPWCWRRSTVFRSTRHVTCHCCSETELFSTCRMAHERLNPVSATVGSRSRFSGWIPSTVHDTQTNSTDSQEWSGGNTRLI